MKVGILGTGRIARAHAEAIRLMSDEYTFASCYDLSESAMTGFAQSYGIRPAATAEEVITNSDLVIIATPNHAHAAFALDCLNSGKSVLCEKPMALNVAQAREMFLKSETTNIPAYVGFNYRYLPIFIEIKRFMDNGAFGSLINVNLQLKRNSAITRKNFTWRDSKEMLRSSGALGDLGVHLFDLIPFLFKQEINLSSCQSKIETKVKSKGGQHVSVDDYAFVKGRLEHGAYFGVCVSKASPENECGLEVDVVGSGLELHYHSRMQSRYFSRVGISWVENEMDKDGHLIPDPIGEVFGWSNSFFNQLLAIRKGHYELSASFKEGYRAQMVLEHLLTSMIPSAEYQKGVYARASAVVGYADSL